MKPTAKPTAKPTPGSRTIVIDPVTRIEGHARIKIEIDSEGRVIDARMMVLELRGFERILQGMELNKLPLVTGRICGVCPTAHHLASVRALDRAYGVTPPPAARVLRELMYMGHFIHSHALALFVLAGPDLVFGPDADPSRRNIMAIVEELPEVATMALRLRTLGQKINETVGGRGIHPVTAVAGGIAFKLTPEVHARLKRQSAEAARLVLKLADVVRDLLSGLLDRDPSLLQQLRLPAYSMGTVKNGKLNLYEGELRIVDVDGAVVAQFDAKDYAKHLREQTFDWSYMKPVYVIDGGELKLHRVNTLARINVADEMETPLAQRELEVFRRRFGRPCHSTLMHHYARLIELVYVSEKACELVNDERIWGETRAEIHNAPRPAVGHVEAPRGTLIHDYEMDSDGVVLRANLIVATQQNYAAINETIRQTAERFITGSDDDVLNWVEFGVRAFDPCLSCATHAYGQMPLIVDVVCEGETVRRIKRGPP